MYIKSMFSAPFSGEQSGVPTQFALRLMPFQSLIARLSLECPSQRSCRAPSPIKGCGCGSEKSHDQCCKGSNKHSHKTVLTGPNYRKRPAGPNLRPDEGPSMLDDPSESPHRSAMLQSQRTPTGLYHNNYPSLGEPSIKRQRTSEDMDIRSLFQPGQYHQRPYTDQRAPAPSLFGNYPTSSLPAYSQGAQPALSNVSDYSYGHQRTNSSNTSSPFVSPHTEVSGHSWTAANVPSSNMVTASMLLQSPAKDTSYTYPSTQYPDMQYSRPNQIPESYMRQRTQTLHSQNLQSQNMQLQSLSSQTVPAQNFASQNMASRQPVNGTLAFPRFQEPENSTGNYGQAGRSLPSSSTYPDVPPRLPPTESMTDYTSPGRQQYPSATMSNTLPPIDASLGSNSGRRGSQQLLPHVLPSIEPRTAASTPSQTIIEQIQENYEGQESYETASYSYPMSHEKRPEGG